MIWLLKTQSATEVISGQKNESSTEVISGQDTMILIFKTQLGTEEKHNSIDRKWKSHFLFMTTFYVGRGLGKNGVEWTEKDKEIRQNFWQ